MSNWGPLEGRSNPGRDILAAVGIVLLCAALAAFPHLGLVIVAIGILGGILAYKTSDGTRTYEPEGAKGVRRAWTNWRTGESPGGELRRAGRAAGNAFKNSSFGRRVHGALTARRSGPGKHKAGNSTPPPVHAAGAADTAVSAPDNDDTPTPAASDTTTPGGTCTEHDTYDPNCDTCQQHNPADQPPADPGTTETVPMEDPTMNSNVSSLYGTQGNGTAAGYTADWATSVDARTASPETFAAWMQQMEAGFDQCSSITGSLVNEYHGRGPGDAGVPAHITANLTARCEEAFKMLAAAYGQACSDYLAHVEEATAQMTNDYGGEVVRAAAGVTKNAA